MHNISKVCIENFDKINPKILIQYILKKIDGKPIVKFDHKKCLSCLICCEACGTGALDFKLDFPFSLISRILTR